MQVVKPQAVGVRVLAGCLVTLGGAAIAMTGAAAALSRGVPADRVVVTIAYGIAGLVAGVLLWRGVAGARRAYLVWCATIACYVLTIPELFVVYAIPGFLAALLLLAWGYRYIARNVPIER